MKSMAGFGGGVASLSMKTVGSDYQFTDWGGGKPVWDTSNSGTTTYALNNSNSPNSSDSTLNPSSHYGMCTDSYGRYIIITPRVYPDNANDDTKCIWIPITSSGPDVTKRIGVRIDPFNSFGGLTDTVRGKHYQAVWASSDIHEYDLPSDLKGSSSSPTGGTTYDRRPRNSPSSIGNYGSTSNDGGCHDVQNDLYYFCGRQNGNIYRLDPTNPNGGFTTLSQNGTQNVKYGISKDPSSNWFVTAYRSSGFYMHNGVQGGADSTYASISGAGSIEDVAIAWTGDLYTYTGQSDSIVRYTRTS